MAARGHVGAWLFVAVLVFGALPANATHPDGLLPLASGGGTGAGWVALRVTLDGGGLVLSLHGEQLSHPAVAEFVVAGHSATASVAYASGRGALVQSDALPPTALTLTPDPRGDGTFALGLKPGYFHGEHVLVAWIAADAIASWTWRLDGAADVRVLGESSGPEAYFRSWEDFAPLGGAAADAGAGVAARATAEGRAVLEGEHRLLFHYYATGTGVERLTVETAEGVQPCPCWEDALDAPLVGRATYTFRLEGVAAGAGDVLLSAADVRLPP